MNVTSKRTRGVWVIPNPIDDDLITKNSAKVSNKVERASNVLVSNVRLNKKIGNRRKRTGWTKRDETGNEVDGVGRTGERSTTKRERERNGRKRG